MRPDSIRKFDMFYLASVALGIASSLMNYDALVASIESQWEPIGIAEHAGTFMFGILSLAVVVNLLLWMFASRMQMGWVKWVLVVFIAYAAITMGGAVAMGAGSVSITNVIATLLKAISVWFLFQPDAKEWFAAKAE